MIRYRCLLPALAVIAVSACSNQQAYQAIQQNRLQECEKLLPAQREECIQQHDEPFDDYQRSREEALQE